MTDRELLGLYRAGDGAAFEVLLERYEGPLLRFATRTCRRGDRDRAQDIVQSTFLRLVRVAREKNGALTDTNGREVENLSAWLYRVTRNLAIDEARKEERMEKRMQAVAVSEVQDAPVSRAETAELVSLVEAKLDALPENQRDVLILKVQEQKSYREISSITGLSVSNVGYLIHRGLKSLASEMRTAGVV